MGFFSHAKRRVVPSLSGVQGALGTRRPVPGALLCRNAPTLEWPQGPGHEVRLLRLDRYCHGGVQEHLVLTTRSRLLGDPEPKSATEASRMAEKALEFLKAGDVAEFTVEFAGGGVSLRMDREGSSTSYTFRAHKGDDDAGSMARRTSTTEKEISRLRKADQQTCLGKADALANALSHPWVDGIPPSLPPPPGLALKRDSRPWSRILDDGGNQKGRSPLMNHA